MNVDELREKYPTFIYESFHYEFLDNDLILNFKYTVSEDIQFDTVTALQDVDKKRFDRLNKNVLDNFVFHVGLLEMLSYWKATCSPEIVLKAGALNDDQIAWLHSLIIKGMGEYFFLNKIDFIAKDFLKITSQNNNSSYGKADITSDKILIPVSGGKDSTLTMALLKDEDIGTFTVDPVSPAAERIVKLSDSRNPIRVQMRIEKKLLQMNNEGYLNGHIPYSAYLAFLSLLSAYLFDFGEIAFSNERSSNEANVSYLGHKINHQYSKTWELENLLRKYNEKYLSNINYYSFLRPFYDIQIVKLFTQYPKYFDSIRSCNKGQKEDKWCCECSKCLSTFILFYAFLGPKRITNVFPQNMYENGSLLPLLKTLVDENEIKPFECVGTRDELKSGLFLSLQHHDESLPPLLKKGKDFVGAHSKSKSLTNELLTSWNVENNVPERFKKLLKSKL